MNPCRCIIVFKPDFELEDDEICEICGGNIDTGECVCGEPDEWEFGGDDAMWDEGE